MDRTIKIGTRDSKLAIWQAEFVKNKLEEKLYKCELIFIKSDGDKNQIVPLYEMGIEGIFTRTLDIALLNREIDIAIHSLKDVPTKLPKGIVLAGIPERGDHRDVLVYKNSLDFLGENLVFAIGTSSLRRKAQFLNKYTKVKVEDLRGNIDTRLKKLEDNTSWKGAIFAKTALDRLEIDIKNNVILDWMLPAPAQGALGIACLENDKEILDICTLVNHKNTEICVKCEREFLSLLMGGCTMPIGAYAQIIDDKIAFKGNILSIDGKQKFEVYIEDYKENYEYIAKKAVAELLKKKNIEKLLKTFR